MAAPPPRSIADPHKPLRDDVRLLGELLGDTLRAQEGTAVFDTVERVRGLAKQARAGDPDACRRLADDLSRMPIELALPVGPAFAHFLNLANIAEQHHRIRRRRDYRRDPSAPPQRGSCEETFARVLREGVSPDRLYEAVCALRIELVLTAHPTEVARRTLVHKYNRIAAALAEADRPDLTPVERDDIVAAIRREIASAWGTSDVRLERPTPLDEVRAGLIVFEQSLWDALPRYLRSVDRALRAATGRPLPIDASPVRFGSWIGGDRDGNPAVTPEVTRRACLLARWVAVDLYSTEIRALRDELSLEPASAELRERTGGAREPYRALLREVDARLRFTREWIESCLDGGYAPAPDLAYVEPGDFLEALKLCYASLVATGYGVVADGRLLDVIRRVSAFGMTLAPLDITSGRKRHATRRPWPRWSVPGTRAITTNGPKTAASTSSCRC